MAEYTCKHCNKKFMNYRSDRSVYCSRACKIAGTTINHEHKCKYCDISFVNKKIKSKYCSFKCTGLANRENLKGRTAWNKGIKFEQIRGSGHWNWQGGKPRDLRLTTVYSDWRKAVFVRDNYTCQKCGVRGNKIIADHIKPFYKYPNLRLDVSNGRTLCVGCNNYVTYISGEWRTA